MELFLYNYRVSTPSWGCIYDVKIIASSKEKAREILDNTYIGWRVEYMGGGLLIKEGFII